MNRQKLGWFTALCGAALMLAAASCQAILYKWTDENGRVVYGDQPPATVKAERVNPGIAPADPGAVRAMAAKDAEIKKRQQQRVDDEAKADKEHAEVKKKADMCGQARGRIKALREDANVYRFNEKGERVFFEPAERQKAITDNEKLMRDLNCPGAPAT
ncbi:MAG TPA: DUF4124 domain-containing protein [Casimicrobiaceae bacterium]|jgi:hypothetical protein